MNKSCTMDKNKLVKGEKGALGRGDSVAKVDTRVSYLGPMCSEMVQRVRSARARLGRTLWVGCVGKAGHCFGGNDFRQGST